jgi:4-hydroxy-tetrahydrodipicolinate synthase
MAEAGSLQAHALTAHAMSITPFGADGELDEALFRLHLEYLAAAGIGVYIASQGSGEGDLLSFDEKVRCYRIAVETIGRTIPVVAAGIGLAGWTRTHRALVRAAEDAGVDAVQILGPRPGPLPMRPDEIEAHFRTLIEEVRACDIHLSVNSVLTGSSVPTFVIEQLLDECRHITVVNVTDRQLEGAVSKLAGRVEVRIGMTAALPRVAADGFLSFEANVAPQLVAAACAQKSFDDLLRLNAALAAGGNPRSLKAALRLLGRDGGELRAPYLALTPPERADLERQLDALGLL